MKVRIVHTLNIDPAAWDLNYGTGTNPADVRADVTSWAANLLPEAARESGVLIEVTHSQCE